jgi:methionyl-tRNA formyltransferase
VKRMPRIGLACMTQRGVATLRHLSALRPDAELTVITTPGEAWEPAFTDDLQQIAGQKGMRYVEARDLGAMVGGGGWSVDDLDVLLLVNWRTRIPARAYNAPARGTFVFHDSLLPAYRGFSPTTWAIINGESQTGATLFAITQEIDAGDIVGQRTVPIGAKDTIATVMSRVTEAYLALLTDHLDGLLMGVAPRRAQDQTAASYGCKRMPEDNAIDWTAPASCIHNLVRAVTHPYPGAYTTLEGRRLRIWSTATVDGLRYVGRVPGAVVEVRPGSGAVVLTGDGALLVERVQLESGPEVTADKALCRLSLRVGR